MDARAGMREFKTHTLLIQLGTTLLGVIHIQNLRWLFSILVFTTLFQLILYPIMMFFSPFLSVIFSLYIFLNLNNKCINM